MIQRHRRRILVLASAVLAATAFAWGSGLAAEGDTGDGAIASPGPGTARMALATEILNALFPPAGAPEAEQSASPFEPPGKPDEWKRRTERLTNLVGFAELLGEGLTEEPLDAYFVRQGLGKPGEKIVGANEEGLRMKAASGERTLPWAEATPKDVLQIARKVLRNSPEPRLALACWCWETGQLEEAKKEIEVAMLTDKMGTVNARIEELFGPQ